MPLIADQPFPKTDVPDAVFLRVLDDTIRTIEATGVPYAVVGGVASAVHGRPRWSNDIDVFVRPVDAERTLAAFADAGFATDRTYPGWLYKALRDDVLVDVLFCIQDTIHLDHGMLAHVRQAEFCGCTLNVVSPEDLLITKVASFSEDTPHYWYDALGLVASGKLDWSYLAERARLAPRRVLSLLVYAESSDVLVPQAVVRELVEAVYGSG
jgi:predicted nucleotidyltransferase